MLLNTELSNRRVFEEYQRACWFVKDNTGVVEFGPFMQEPPDDVVELGCTMTDRVTASQLCSIKTIQAGSVSALADPIN